MLFLLLPPRAMQALELHMQACASLSFLGLVLDGHKQKPSCVGLISHSHYLEEPHHCYLELGRELPNPKLWRDLVSSERTVNREDGRE